MAVSVAVDALVVAVLAYPQTALWMRWPLLGLYVVLSVWVYRMWSKSQWMLALARDRGTRVAHGLEHATIAVLEELGANGLYGFTFDDRCFVVGMEAGQHHDAASVHDAAECAIRRVRAGEHRLTVHRLCSTTRVIPAFLLWLTYVISLAVTLATSGFIPVFVASATIVLRIAVACSTSLGLLAQQWFTVSTAFESARVVQVREIPRRWEYKRADHVWFEVTIAITLAAREGGVVAPGVL
jgi:hypothetical protein